MASSDSQSSDSEDDTYGPKPPPPAPILGPTLPPQMARGRGSSDDEDEDDTYGPQMPNSQTARDYSSSRILPSKSEQSTSGPKREEWMTVVPDKIEARIGFKSVTSFSQKSSSSAETATKNTPISQLELPNNPPEVEDTRIKGPSLLELHQQKRLEKKRKRDTSGGPDEEKRKPLDFDPEKQLATRRMNSRQTNSVISKAKLLNTRFSSGSSKFL